MTTIDDLFGEFEKLADIDKSKKDISDGFVSPTDFINSYNSDKIKTPEDAAQHYLNGSEIYGDGTNSRELLDAVASALIGGPEIQGALKKAISEEGNSNDIHKILTGAFTDFMYNARKSKHVKKVEALEGDEKDQYIDAFHAKSEAFFNPLGKTGPDKLMIGGNYGQAFEIMQPIYKAVNDAAELVKVNQPTE